MKNQKARELCPALQQALRDTPTLREVFAALPPSHQREYNQWIAGAKKATTQTARAAQALTMMAARHKTKKK